MKSKINWDLNISLTIVFLAGCYMAWTEIPKLANRPGPLDFLSTVLVIAIAILLLMPLGVWVDRIRDGSPANDKSSGRGDVGNTSTLDEHSERGQLSKPELKD